MSTELPKTIGPYEVIRPLGTGGMAMVYEVEERQTGERLALKLHLLRERGRKRFDLEYEAMTRLNHPNIVRVFSYGEHEGSPWLTMELLRAEPVHQWLKRFGGPGTPERTDEVLRISATLSRALEYLHQRKLVHRDVKASNVLITFDGRVKLIDLGTAHLIDTMSRITADGEFVGTWDYGSPEQYLGHRPDGRVDLYALGVLMFRLLTGRRPFRGSTPEELAKQHVHEVPPDPRSYVGSLDPNLCALVLALLNKQPDKRPWPASEVARAVERIANRSFGAVDQVALHADASVLRDRERRELLDGVLATGPGSGLMLIGGARTGLDLEHARLGVEAGERGWLVKQVVLDAGSDVRQLLTLLAQDVDAEREAERIAVAALQRLAVARIEVLVDPTARQAMARAGADALLASARAVSRAGDAQGDAAADRGVLLLSLGRFQHATSLTHDLVIALQEAVRKAGAPVRFLAALDPEQRLTPVRAADRVRDVRVVHLAPMADTEVARAIGAMLGRRPPPPAVSRAVFDATGGQPGFVQDLVDGLVRSGRLRAEANLLSWGTLGLTIDTPQSARDWATETLIRISATARQLVEALSISGVTFNVEQLAYALNWEEVEVRALGEQLRAARIARVDGDHISLRDMLLGRLVRERLWLPRLRLLQHRIVILLTDEQRATADGVTLLIVAGQVDTALTLAGDVAEAYLAAGRVKQALALLDAAMSRAPSGAPDGRWAKVAWLYGRCLQIVEPLDPAASRALADARARGAEELGLKPAVKLAQSRLAVAIGHHKSAVRSLDEAKASLSDSSLPALRAEVALEQVQHALWQGALGWASRLIDQAGSVCEAPDAQRQLATYRAEIAYAAAELAEAERLGRDVLREGSRDQQLRALPVLVLALRGQGRWSEALSLVRGHVALARSVDDPAAYMALLVAAAWCEVDLFRLGRAQEHVDELGATLRKGEYLHLRLEAELVAGRILIASGQAADAAWMLRGIADRARTAELVLLREQGRVQHGEALAFLGDTAKATDLMRAGRLGLMGAGHKALLADACVAESRTLGYGVDPDQVYAPVIAQLDAGAFPGVQLEHLLHRARWQRSRNESTLATVRSAAMLLNRLASKLEHTEQAALRVHPWSGRIRRGLG